MVEAPRRPEHRLVEPVADVLERIQRQLDPRAPTISPPVTTVAVPALAVSLCWRRSTGTGRLSGTIAAASVVRVLSGPSSTNVRAPASARACRPSAKRTESRMWRTQYSGSVCWSGPATVPVTLETRGMLGRW
jgi:hypothetical protein